MMAGNSALRRSWWFKRSLNVGALGDEITGNMVGGAMPVALYRGGDLAAGSVPRCPAVNSRSKAVYRGGDLAAGPMTRAVKAVSPQLKAISLELVGPAATATAMPCWY
eukprot:Skav203429  [mRNA]  locus=scaffold727:40603:42911:+ [translate_table: standard]